MGQPKGLLTLRGEPLLVQHVRALSGVAERIVVALGAQAEAHRRVLPEGVVVVENPDWATTWPADSLALALRQAELDGPCLVTPVDVPPAHPDTLQALIEAGAPAVPTDRDGRPGHPVLLDAQLVRRIRRVAPEGGLRTLLTRATRVAVTDPDVAWDFNTPERWQAWLQRARGDARRGGLP